jgi:hypothetical protein
LKLRIDYIFPAHDDVIVALSRARHIIPVVIITSPPGACEITRSKSDTYRALSGKINVPQLYDSVESISDYPVLVKPDRGQGSFGIVRADDKSLLISALQTVPNPIICEYLPGEEYTVDCFSDRERGVLFAEARSRRRTRNGISMNTLSLILAEAREMAEVINGEFGLHGAWFFQLKRDRNGQLKLLEVAPRIAGTMAAHRVMGVNFPLLSIFEEERLPICIKCNAGAVELDRALANRYRHSITYSVLYIDLDDTIVVNGCLNTQAVTLIFQSIEKGIPVILLTKHGGNLHTILAKYRLLGLFDEIIQLNKEEKKSSYIRHRDAILVDDSFSERMDVVECCDIPTFDCSMIELLTEQAELLD